jgi:hypothetical protein
MVLKKLCYVTQTFGTVFISDKYNGRGVTRPFWLLLYTVFTATVTVELEPKTRVCAEAVTVTGEL